MANVARLLSLFRHRSNSRYHNSITHFVVRTLKTVSHSTRPPKGGIHRHRPVPGRTKRAVNVSLCSLIQMERGDQWLQEESGGTETSKAEMEEPGNTRWISIPEHGP